MKLKRTLATITIVVVLGLSIPVFAHQGGSRHNEQPMMGPMGMMGSMHGMHHGGGMGMHHMDAMGGFGHMGMGGGLGHGMGLGMLDLTDNQLDTLDQFHDQQRKLHWEIHGKIMDEQSQLRKLYRAETPNAEAIGEVYGRIFDYRRQLIEARIETHNKKRELLTDEQR